MKRCAAAALALLGLASCLEARADGGAYAPPSPLNEISAAVTYFRLQSGYNTIGSIGTGYRGLEYGRFLTDRIEASARLHFSASGNTDSSPGEVILDATVGPTFNLPAGGTNDISNAFFATFEFGISYVEVNNIVVPGTAFQVGSQYATNPEVSIELGKRFALLPNLTFRPSIAVTAIIGNDLVAGTGTATPAYSVYPVAFSVVF